MVKRCANCGKENNSSSLRCPECSPWRSFGGNPQAEIIRLTAELETARNVQDRLMTERYEYFKRAEKAESQRDQLSEQYTTACRTIDKLATERDQALARAAAAAKDMRERAAGVCDEASKYYISDPEHRETVDVVTEQIRALPIDPDAEDALKRVVDETWNEAVEAAANSANSLAGHDETLRWCVSEIRALARPTSNARSNGNDYT